MSVEADKTGSVPAHLTATTWLTGLSLSVWGALSVACLFLFSLGLDESWIAQGVRTWLDPVISQDYHTPPVYTSGGLYSLAQLALEASGVTEVAWRRAPSWLALAALVALVFERTRRAYGSKSSGLLAVCALAAVPDTAVVASACLGTTLGFLLFYLAILGWCRSESPGARDAILFGGLFGLAVATRLDLLPMVVGLVLLGIARTSPTPGLRSRFPRWELVAAGMVLAVTAANIGVHRVTSAVLDMSTADSLKMYGVGGAFLAGLLDYPYILNKLLLAQDAAPFPLLAMATALPFLTGAFGTEGRPAERSSLQPRAILALLIMGWILWGAWLIRARPPHLRYLWPSLMCFALVAGDRLAWLHQRAFLQRRWGAATGFMLIGLASAVGAAGLTFRAAVMGQQDYLAWERSREMGADYYRRFQHVRDQADVARYLRNKVDPDTRIVTIDVPEALRYLTRRPITQIDHLLDRPPSTDPVLLVLTPSLGTYFWLRPEAQEWIASRTTLKAQFGRYSVYQAPNGLPADLRPLIPRRTNHGGHPLSSPWFNWGWTRPTADPPPTLPEAAPQGVGASDP